MGYQGIRNMSPEQASTNGIDSLAAEPVGRVPAALSPDEKRALLGQLLRSRAERPRHIPLSAAQERLWLVHELEPDSPVHNVSVVHHLAGPLDAHALERALGEVVGRHESLRTTFAVVDGRPVQVIAPAAAFCLARVDRSSLPDSDWMEEVRRSAAVEARTPFDLQRGPLLRCKLLGHTPQEHALVVTLHHIIADRWSLGILAQEVSSLYAALLAGDPSPLAHPPGQYAAFGEWQQEWLRGADADKQRAYWKARLDGRVPELRLPTDRRPVGAPTYRGERMEFHLSDGLTRDLAAWSAALGVTPYVTLLAEFSALLHQRTGQDDLILCAPVAGRHRPQTKGVVGYFNNVMPLRIDLSGEPSFRLLLGRVSQAAREAYEAQDIPFQWIAALPNLARTPLTPCLFSLQTTQSLAFQLPGVRADYRDVHGGTANFDLAVFFEERDGRLAGIIDFKTDLFSGPAVEQLIEQYQNILLELIGRSDRCLSTLPSSPPQQPRPCQAFDQVAPPLVSATGDHDGRPQTEAPAAPRDELERRLTQIWEEVLGVRPIDADSNFFDLGGHSLLAARLFARLEQEFAQELPLAMLLRAPTIREM
jgi:acyl carrier protein